MTIRKDKSFTEILAYRGRIVIFTPSAAVGVKFEQCAERNHAQVVVTRGYPDSYMPLANWQRMHATRTYAVLSCDKMRYVKRDLPATDLVWVGDNGHPEHSPVLRRAFDAAMHARAYGDETRLWHITPDQLLADEDDDL